MYSKYFSNLKDKELMVQVSEGEDSLVLFNAYLKYADEDIFVIHIPKFEKEYIFNASDITMIGIGHFEPPTGYGEPEIKNKNDRSYL